MKRLAYACGCIAVSLSLFAIVSASLQSQEAPVSPVNAQPWGQLRTAAPSLWGELTWGADGRQVVTQKSWYVSVPLDNLAPTFAEAMQKYNRGALTTGASTLRTGAFELSSRLVDFRANPEEVNPVKDQLQRRGMLANHIVAYRVTAVPEDEVEAQRLFEFAKELGCMSIVVEHSPRSVEMLDRLVRKYEISVALDEPTNPTDFLKLVGNLDSRIGAYIDPARWESAGIKTADALALLKSRVMAVHLSGKTDPALLKAIYANGINPLFFSIEYHGSGDSVLELSRSLDEFEVAFQPVAAERLAAVGRVTKALGPEHVSEQDREAVLRASPDKPLAQPKKSRKLLVIDLSVGHSYHPGVAPANLALQTWAEKTHAFAPIYSNDLDNLKYPEIGKYDAIFLNCTVGEVVVDLQLRANLLRFVREGGGLIGYHGMAAMGLDWPEFGAMTAARLGGGRARRNTVPFEEQKGYLVVEDEKNPITASLLDRQEKWGPEEFYPLETPPFSRETVHVLLSVDRKKSDPNECTTCDAVDDLPVAWIRNYGKGRIFYTSLGHHPSLFETPDMVKFMLAGVQFALGDLEADATPSSNRPQ